LGHGAGAITGHHYFYLCFRDENKLHEIKNKNQYMKIVFFGPGVCFLACALSAGARSMWERACP
jgi:hypothetical protein